MIGRFGCFAFLAIAMAGRADAAAFEAVVHDAAGAPLADAVVSLVPASGPLKAAAGKKASIDQRGLRFVPSVLAVQTGTEVQFPNSDQVRHHVYSFSPAKTFELRLYKDHPTSPVTFDRAGVATIGCNIHDWMIGYVVVVDTPHFALTDATGQARIDGVPPGEYLLSAWQSRLSGAAPEPIRVSVTATPGTPRDIALVVGPPAPEPAPPSELEQKFRRFQKSPDAEG
ncbi:methylamine utilization protein [Dokdonella sp. MW10]|uniref:methylamine utilization protein n=1 Tax=Dokdonella sp. MW10 TaxID=2992926 RepID=UPI003F804849